MKISDNVDRLLGYASKNSQREVWNLMTLSSRLGVTPNEGRVTWKWKRPPQGPWGIPAFALSKDFAVTLLRGS